VARDQFVAFAKTARMGDPADPETQVGPGRENGQDAIYEYLQQKSVWISTADEVPNPFVLR
jgi:aldehyde dehydrogenase (NAD+)